MCAGEGTQYDRLASVYLDGIELWRHDNPEPSYAGVVWNAKKDISKYYHLIAKVQPRDVVLSFPNYVNKIDNGLLNVTLDIIVHVPRATEGYIGPSPLAGRTAEHIVPLSHESTEGDSKFSVGGTGNPPLGNTSVSLPRNTRAALVEIYASGTSQEEFWYTSISDSLYSSLSPGQVSNLGLYPHGPVREVQVRVDNRLAGFAQPMAVIFTGGICPGMWRPMVSFGTFDQPTYTLDLTPFVPILADGQPHNVSLAVVSAEKNGTIDASWFVSGNIQATLDLSGKPTTGRIVHYEADELPYASLRSYYRMTGNSTFEDIVESKRPRSLKIEAVVKTGSDSQARRIRWHQTATTFANNTVANGGNAQINVVNSQGTAHASHGGQPFLSYRWDLPLAVSSIGTNDTLSTQVAKGYDTHLSSADQRMGLPEWTHIRTQQRSSGGYDLDAKGYLTSIYGNASQHYVYADANANTFERSTRVWDVNDTTAVTRDRVSGSLALYAAPVEPPS